MPNTPGFKPNVGTADRLIRILAGILCINAWIFVPSVFLGWVLAAIGLILIATGILSLCPIYAVLGLRTCPISND